MVDIPFNIGGDDSTMRNISSGESIKIWWIKCFIASDVEGNITISASLSRSNSPGPSAGDMTYYNGTVWVATASVIRYVLGANGSNRLYFYRS